MTISTAAAHDILVLAVSGANASTPANAVGNAWASLMNTADGQTTQLWVREALGVAGENTETVTAAAGLTTAMLLRFTSLTTTQQGATSTANTGGANLLTPTTTMSVTTTLPAMLIGVFGGSGNMGTMSWANIEVLTNLVGAASRLMVGYLYEAVAGTYTTKPAWTGIRRGAGGLVALQSA